MILLSDSIIRGLIGEDMRFFAADSRETVNTAYEIHHTTPVATAALGRLLTAAAMMGYMLKNEEDKLTLIIKGDGPLGGIVVTGDSRSCVKGYVYENHVDLPLKSNSKLDVSGAIGKGTITVIQDSGAKEPYSSQIPLVSGEIAEDLTYYFSVSEQTPSAVSLGVLVDRDWSVRRAGGFIIQAMPAANGAVISAIENNLKSMPSITALLENGRSPEDIIEMAAAGLDWRVLDKRPMKFYCSCDKERVEKALISLGRAELDDMLSKDGGAELSCHFCGKTYQFNQTELKELVNSLASSIG